MNKLIVLVLLAVLAMPIASAHVTMYFEPQDSSVSGGYPNTTYIRLMANITSPDNLLGGQVAIYHNKICANITNLQWGPQIFTMMSSWNAAKAIDPCPGENHDWIMFAFMASQTGVVEICNLTIQCNCSSCDYCISPLDFTCGISGCSSCPIEVLKNIGGGTENLYPANATLVNGTVACGVPSSAETFSKPLYEGWNLISLPLDPEDGTASAVLSGVSYDAVYRYNATSKQFEGIESADVMNPGTGYFVYVITECTWEYSGMAYNSISTSLEQGLNMVGWLNCSKGVGDALSSISDEYYYVARWNTSAGKFEVYNPAAPSMFNDFTTVNRGTGYFVSARCDCTLSDNC